VITVGGVRAVSVYNVDSAKTITSFFLFFNFFRIRKVREELGHDADERDAVSDRVVDTGKNRRLLPLDSFLNTHRNHPEE